MKEGGYDKGGGTERRSATRCCVWDILESQEQACAREAKGGRERGGGEGDAMRCDAMRLAMCVSFWEENRHQKGEMWPKRANETKGTLTASQRVLVAICDFLVFVREFETTCMKIRATRTGNESGREREAHRRKQATASAAAH